MIFCARKLPPATRRGRRDVLFVLALVVIELINPSNLRAASPDVVFLTTEIAVGLNDDNILGEPIDALWSPNGLLLVLDGQLKSVEVFDAKGVRIRSLGGPGTGLGELQVPLSLHLEDNGTVGVLDVQGNRMVRYATDGTVLSDTSMLESAGGSTALLDVREFGKQRVRVERRMEMQNNTVFTYTEVVVRDHRDGRKVLVDHVQELDMARPRLVEEDMSRLTEFWTLTNDGRVVVAPFYLDYKLQVFELSPRPEAETVRIITRERDRIRRSEDELARLHDAAAKRAAQTLTDFDFVPSEFVAPVKAVQASPEGGFWVRLALERTRNGGQAREALFDRFSGDGEYEGSTLLRAEADLGRADLIFSGEKILALVHPARSSEEPAHVLVLERK